VGRWLNTADGTAGKICVMVIMMSPPIL